MRRWSLRTRLVVTMLTLLAVASLIVGVTTAVTLRRSVYGSIDEQLSAAASRAPRGLAPPGGPDYPSPQQPDDATGCDPDRAPDFPAGQVIGTLAARLCDGQTNVRILVEQGQDQPDLSGYTQDLGDVPVDGPAQTISLGSWGDYRVRAQRLPDGAVLVTGLPLADAQATIYLVVGTVAVVTAAVLLLVGVTGTLTVRRSLRPLSRMAATAGRVSRLRLDRGEVTLPDRVDPADTDPHTEVGQVGAALNRMLDHVGQALAVRHASETRVRQFVADASHELRTPLAAIRGYAELSRRSAEVPPPETAHVLRRVESEARRMTLLVEDLLLLARLDTGRPLVAEPVDLTRLVVDAVSDAHATSPAHDWQLDLPPEPVTVTGDPARLQQVLVNLLANARTHTPDGTTVTVSVTGRDPAGDPTGPAMVLLRVVDTGPGIPDALAPHVFERFARGDTSRSRAAGSTGLGLAIVHAVVTAHGGTVALTSAPGHTEFTVRLPTATTGPIH
ncbi:HAMP domain-containing sensor histidine kinase [Solwaraspora sp. WMMA2056]|uniref:sensor histidine kinase n=1 Tax=Solwaraspora sp. WMMA2056 TaxID=3015161 RepID=UPI00259B00D4|nr:HAMP domain-containing sensor histidine kinase [Solwaraspora sp. WMMA2056]WJK38532.1 HAMP domain-containing sensor histidine kinase [Solwaraspora sp. WMMA2056]